MRRPLETAILASLMVAALTASPARSDTAVAEVAVEVLDARGRQVAGLAPEDLAIRAGDAVVAPLAVRPLAGEEVPVAIYVDRALATSGTVRRAAEGLAGHVRALVALGEVAVVTTGVESVAPTTELRTAESLILGEKLSRLALIERGEAEILAIRGRFLEQLAAGASYFTGAEKLELAREALAEERELISNRQRQLLAWAGQQVASGPGLLLLVADGFDVDPVSFYRQHLDDGVAATLAGDALSADLDAAAERTATALAALGWTVTPLRIAPPAGRRAVGGTSSDLVDEQGESAGTAGISVRPGAIFRRGDEGEEAVPTLLAPERVLERYATATSGEVTTTEPGLRDALERFAGRYRVSYRPPPTTPPGELRRLQVEARGDRRARAPGWLSRGAPEALAAARLEQLLVSDEIDGGLDVAAVLQLPPASVDTSVTAQLEARVDLRDLAAERAAWDAATLRVTVQGPSASGGSPPLLSEVISGQDLRPLLDWIWRREVELPPGSEDLAVLIEDLGSGRWGGRRATVLSPAAGLADGVLPSPEVVEILRPEREVLRGRIQLEADVYHPGVRRVAFLLDDREVAETRSPPWAARIDLGRTPRRRELTVIAFDAAGEELGRDAAILNGGSGGLAVDIVRPTANRAVGDVEVEAEIAVPVERRLDRVLFFWNSDIIATLYQRPFRQRIRIPPAAPAGYVRVVAMLDDGTLAEDVRFLNGPAASDRLDVSLVELYVVVTGADGRPVRGLDRSDFRVREDGRQQEIAAFSDASDLPLTLGMAIDSSASMFVKLPNVQQAAIEFLRSTFNEQDRAFVVDFDSRPRLARGTTRDLDRVVRSIESLEASGRTALWESVVFSLVQLQNVKGRKALVMFSDGADEDDDFPFSSALGLAKKMGVPIYLILMKKKPRDSAGMSLLSRSFSSRVDRLVRATGGRAFYAREYPDLGDVYDEIEEELRSQYLLTYYPESGGDNWRDVDVEVAGKGLRPRTLSGYWPQ